MQTQKVYRHFKDTWPILRDDVVAVFATRGMPQDAIDWYTRNLDYNVLGGKLLRGRSVVDSFGILKGRPLSDDEYFRAVVLGWCVELMLASGLVADDIMDKSLTRRGQLCWYKVDGVNLKAVNDAFILEGTIFFLLKKYFRGVTNYVELIELFREMIYRTEIGQLLDLLTDPEDCVDLDKFSIEKYRLIAVYKSSYSSIYLPIALAMHMSGFASTDILYETAKEICLVIGEYGQVQDDFLDFAGLPEHTGKVGTDIVNNKCSWCIITALQLCSSEQRGVLEENYGRKDSDSEGKVRQVFEQVGLRERYVAYEEEAYRRISEMIQKIPEGSGLNAPVLRREVFRVFLDKLYKRSK